jgi:hypothetical protein
MTKAWSLSQDDGERLSTVVVSPAAAAVPSSEHIVWPLSDQFAHCVSPDHGERLSTLVVPPATGGLDSRGGNRNSTQISPRGGKDKVSLFSSYPPLILLPSSFAHTQHALPLADTTQPRAGGDAENAADCRLWTLIV